MKYEVYHLLIDDLERAYHQDNKRVKGYPGRGHQHVLRVVYRNNPELIQTLDSVIMAEENLWLNHSPRHVVFINDGQVADKLLNAKIDLNNAAPVILPHNSYVVAVPRDYHYQGFKIPACLVTFDSKANRSKIFKYFGDLADVNVGEPDFPDDLCDGVSICYRAAETEPDGISRFTSRIIIRFNDLPNVLRAKNGLEFASMIGQYEDEYTHLAELNPKDVEIQFRALRLVVMSALYANNFPDALRPGYPVGDKIPKHLEPKLHGKWSTSHLGMPQLSTDKHYHYRSWHFRQLMDKRYYQGEHANKPLGSRIVFVKDAMVAREVAAETLS